MEKKNSVGRYSLIFEPKYVTHQYAVSFDNVGNSSVVAVNKYSDTPCGTKAKVKKNSLSEIDRVTAACPDLDTFFKTHVPAGIFMYQGNNLHKMFIGYMRNNYMYNLNYIINNPELLSKLDLVSGSRIYDADGINSMIRLITTSENNGFLDFIVKEKREKSTGLSSETINLAALFRNAEICGDSYIERDELRRNLEEKLGSYKEYREMFLLQMHYQDKLAAERLRLEQLRSEATSVVSPRVEPTPFEGTYTEGEQLSLFGEEPTNRVLSKKNNARD